MTIIELFFPDDDIETPPPPDPEVGGPGNPEAFLGEMQAVPPAWEYMAFRGGGSRPLWGDGNTPQHWAASTRRRGGGW